MDFNLDQDALIQWARQSDGLKQLQENANQAIRRVVREVNATHAGKSYEEVDRELRRRFGEAGTTLVEPGFSTTVKAITDDSVVDNDGDGTPG